MAKRKKGKYQNREIYLHAALDIIREDGVDRLTMRHLAEKLDVSPMAVYKHFANKNELLKALLDAFIARADVIPRDDLSWQAWVRQVALNMHQALQGETVWLTVLGTLDLGDNAMAVTRAFLETLIDNGFSPQLALQAYVAMIQVVLGSTFLQSAINQHHGKAIAGLSENLGATGNREALLGQPQIEAGLHFLIQGMESALAQGSS